MTDERRKAIGWVLGAAAVVFGLGLYLWLTTPIDDLLSETYSVM